jgi:hypothetical protein
MSLYSTNSNRSDQTIHISSADRVSGDSNDYIITFDNIKAYHDEFINMTIHQAIIPNVFSIINSNNNRFKVGEKVGAGAIAYRTITLNTGFPEGSQASRADLDIQKIVQDLLNTDQEDEDITYACSINKYTKKFEIVVSNATGSAVEVDFDFSTDASGISSSIYKVLGFTSNTSVETGSIADGNDSDTIISDRIVNLAGYDSLFIRTDRSLDNSYETSRGGHKSNILAEIQNSSAPFDFVFWKPTNNSHVIRLNPNDELNSLHIRLTDGENNLVDTEEYEWRFTILITHKKITLREGQFVTQKGELLSKFANH